MLRGIYTAATAMSLSMQKMNVFAQNLSNSSTTGYKKKTYSVHSFKDMMVNLPDVNNAKRKQELVPIATGSYIDQAGVRQKQGRLRQTGNTLDLAVKGEGKYFQLELNPEIAGTKKSYTTTRDGQFMLNKDNYIVNQNGDMLLDTNGDRIRLMNNNPNTKAPVDPNKQESSIPMNALRIDATGRIFDTRQATAANPNPAALAQIRLVDFNAGPPVQGDNRGQMMEILKKYGLELPKDDTLLANSNLPVDLQANPGTENMSILQGYIEESNVDITSEMIAMMMTSKDYDMSQKIISTEDKVLDKTINEMGRLQ